MSTFTSRNVSFCTVTIPPLEVQHKPRIEVSRQKLANAAQNIGEKLIVIANPDNGPGTHQDQNYSSAIGTVRHNGGKVIGYVHTCYGNQTRPNPSHPLCPKTEASVKKDVDTWYALYPMLDGIFYDEVSSQQQQVSYYQALYSYVQEKQPGAIVINNHGTLPPPDYFEIGASFLCIFESEFSDFVGWKSASLVVSERTLALIYNMPSKELSAALEHLSRENVGWFYFTPDKLPNPWDTLPPYFPDLVKAISDQHSLQKTIELMEVTQ